MTVNEYNDIVWKLGAHVLRFAKHGIGSEDEAKDIAQESFAALWKNIDSVEVEKAKSYLFTVAHRKVIDARKKGMRNSDLENYKEIPFVEDNFTVKELVRNAVAKLPDNLRTLITLRDLEGYDYKQIEEITGYSESQVKVYLFRARKQLKDIVMKMETSSL